MALKKSLFSKPKWAAKAASPVEVDRPIFEQNVYEDILEVNRKKEEKRLARQKLKEEERRRKSESRDTKVDEDDKPVKKQRISTEPIHIEEDGDDDFDRRGSDSDSDRSSRSNRSRRRRSVTPEKKQEKPVLRSNPKKDEQISSGLDLRSPSKPTSTPIPLDADDDFAIIEVEPAPTKANSKQKPKPPPPPESESDPEEDEYIKELKRQARAETKARKAAASAAAAEQQSADSPATDGRSASFNPLPGTAGSVSASATPTPGGQDPSDPEVQILIKTLIPNCEPLIVKRRASQPLSQVLTYYIEKHQLGYMSSKLFFTWNGTKLFKSTTMKSILAMIKAKHGTKKDGSDLAEGKIEIEAVTDEIYRDKQAFKERERIRRENGDQDPEPQPGGDTATQSPAEDEAPKRGQGTVIHLKSNDDPTLPNMNLRVHPHTTIEKIVRGYKRKMGVDMGRQVYLVFDGDKLEENQTVGDVGFEDGDSVELGAKS
ncbi:hypothetical protein PMZ80_004398 [Knufia obscura]|uniref:Ubiquitin-like domain-containing protein n=2 Tax=Knufia TaxID=430999 RepID=A0AAN8I6K3_9EURO|nr:hypothetical protein PMZ80_004398 [Knufia obscura]KAK5951725.1 hypothetical protein OHC33_007404 [Knufia fluminis]